MMEKILPVLFYVLFNMFVLIANLKCFAAQGSITNLVCEIFGIEHDYFGTVLSSMARVSSINTIIPGMVEPGGGKG